MLALIKNFYNQAEEIKGRKLALTLISIFIVFLFIGGFIAYITSPKLNNNENIPVTSSPGTAVVTNKKFYEGKIRYVNPEFYPGEDISYMLVDAKGKQLYLLKSNDKKLSVAEGLSVKISGYPQKTKDGKDVLYVQEVILKNATN